VVPHAWGVSSRLEECLWFALKGLEDLVVHMAKENRGWGYDRLAEALAHLGYEISDQTVGNNVEAR